MPVPALKPEPQFEPEQRLIEHLARIAPEPETSLALARQVTDWDHVLRTAETHRVVPLVRSGLRDLPAGTIPERVIERLRESFRAIASYNFARATQLIRITDLLEENGFPVLSYKGLPLAETAYGDVRLRQFTDLDLLVRKEDFPGIKRLLAGLECLPAWDLTGKQEEAVLRHYYEFPFLYGEAGTLVEVHWDFIESFFVFDHDTDAVRERARTVRLYGRKVRTLSNEDHLIVLCSHGSKHFWRRLSWICDVDRLVTNADIDWDLVLGLAEETGSRRMLLLGLRLSQDVLGTELPDRLEQMIGTDPTAVELARKFARELFVEDAEPDDWKEMARIHMRMRENVSTKLVYSQRLFMTKLVDKLFMPMGRPR